GGSPVCDPEPASPTRFSGIISYKLSVNRCTRLRSFPSDRRRPTARSRDEALPAVDSPSPAEGAHEENTSNRIVSRSPRGSLFQFSGHRASEENPRQEGRGGGSQRD